MPKDERDHLDEVFDEALQQRAKLMMRRHRESKGWTQKEMADFLGTSPANYQKYELPQKEGAEKRNVPMRVIFRFCDRAGVDLYLMISGKRPAKAE